MSTFFLFIKEKCQVFITAFPQVLDITFSTFVRESFEAFPCLAFLSSNTKENPHMTPLPILNDRMLGHFSSTNDMFSLQIKI